MEKKICGIYCIENLINSKKYIGQSIDITRRFSQHKIISAINKGYFLYQAFKKYEIKNFEFKVLEECDECNLNEREKYWIEHFQTYKYGYNMTLGGDCSQNKGSSNRRDITPKNFKLFSQNISDAAVEIVELNSKLDIINKWNSVQSCARDTGLFATNISKCANLKYLSTGNRIFMYANDVDGLSKNDIINLRNKKRNDLGFEKHYSYLPCKIAWVDDKLNVIEVFNSINQAAKILNLDCSSITKVCKGRIKQTNGYKFIYYDI